MLGGGGRRNRRVEFGGVDGENKIKTWEVVDPATIDPEVLAKKEEEAAKGLYAGKLRSARHRKNHTIRRQSAANNIGNTRSRAREGVVTEADMEEEEYWKEKYEKERYKFIVKKIELNMKEREREGKRGRRRKGKRRKKKRRRRRRTWPEGST